MRCVCFDHISSGRIWLENQNPDHLRTSKAVQDLRQQLRRMVHIQRSAGFGRPAAGIYNSFEVYLPVPVLSEISLSSSAACEAASMLCLEQHNSLARDHPSRLEDELSPEETLTTSE